MKFLSKIFGCVSQAKKTTRAIMKNKRKIDKSLEKDKFLAKQEFKEDWSFLAAAPVASSDSKEALYQAFAAPVPQKISYEDDGDDEVIGGASESTLFSSVIGSMWPTTVKAEKAKKYTKDQN